MTYVSAREPQILGSVQPLAVTETALCTLAPNQNAFASVFITNTGNVPDQVRLAIKASTEPLDDKHYILYDTPVGVEQFVIIPNLGLNAGDQIVIYSKEGLTNFNATGEQIVNSP